ncbi:MAG: hypothetical protein KF845_13130 [Cyclobacteriaceae bacterium]|nr:hypothetical protein [Cyclobacteriaceae bacterium]
MKTNIHTKEFDAVETMRSIREKIAKEIQGMTFEQEKEYLKKRTDEYQKRKRNSRQ